MGYLLDIDGTILEAGRPIDGAPEAIRTLRDRGHALLFATNTSRKSRGDVAESLRTAGVDVRDDEILSAGAAAAAWLGEQGIRRVHLLLTESAARDWTDFETDAARPEAVVVGDLGPSFDFGRLNTAFRHLRAGARLVAAQKNRAWIDVDGWTLDAGPFVAALEYAAETEADVVGKPAPVFFRMAAAMLEQDPGSLTIVGDDLESDVAGGLAAGMRTVLVRTGKFDGRRLAEVRPDRAPHHVIDSIRDLADVTFPEPGEKR